MTCAIDAEIPADVIFIALFQKHLAENAPIPLGHFVQNFTDFLFHLLGGDCPEHIHCRIGQLVLRLVVK